MSALAIILIWPLGAIILCAIALILGGINDEYPPTPMIICAVFWPAVVVALAILGFAWCCHSFGRLIARLRRPAVRNVEPAE